VVCGVCGVWCVVCVVCGVVCGLCGVRCVVWCVVCGVCGVCVLVYFCPELSLLLPYCMYHSTLLNLNLLDIFVFLGRREEERRRRIDHTSAAL
jgi:hypothetical protein